jgi:hypothetical protein
MCDCGLARKVLAKTFIGGLFVSWRHSYKVTAITSSLPTSVLVWASALHNVLLRASVSRLLCLVKGDVPVAPNFFLAAKGPDHSNYVSALHKRPGTAV